MWIPGRKLFPLFAGIVACAHLAVFDSSAQSYPVKPIRIVVGYSPGGFSDVITRLIATKLSEPLGQPVLVENRPGASGTIATERVVKSPADGYTLLESTITDTVMPALRALPYDLERDLAPVTLFGTLPFVLLVHPSVPARNIKELVAIARAQPGKLNYGSVGLASSPHLTAELMGLIAKAKFVHVPYKGGGEAIVALAAGQIDMYFSSIPSLLPLLDSGKIRPLAVTSAKRASLMPSLPTFAESGLPGCERSSWLGAHVPAGVPKDIITRLNAAFVKVINTPELTESLRKQGLEPQANTPEQYAAFVRSEMAQNAKLIKLVGVKAE